MQEIVKKGTTIEVYIVTYNENWSEHHCSYKYQLESDSSMSEIWKEANASGEFECGSQYAESYSVDVELKELAS
jgi:hypothetical protein